MRRWGEAQRSFATYIWDFSAVGCPVLTLADIASAMTEDRCALMVGAPGGLTAEEADEFVMALPQLRASCEELSLGPIPLSLDHGDFRAENILLDAATGEPWIIDFGAAAISHPFFSAVTLIEHDDFTRTPEDIAQLQSDLREAYLSTWTTVATGC